MKRTTTLLASLSRAARYTAVGFAAFAATACADTSDTTSETETGLSAIEAAQEQLGDLSEMDETPGGCLYELAVCLAEEGEDCGESFKECHPKPPKAEALQEAAAECKALADAGMVDEDGAMKPGMSPPEGDMPPKPEADGDMPPKPEGDGEMPPKPEADGDMPPKPEGDMPPKPEGELDCKKVKKALHKAKKHHEHMKKVAAPCLEALGACVTQGDEVEACVTEARECIKDRAAKAFEMMCEKSFEKCDAGEIAPEKCGHIADRCAEGPKPPAPPVSDDSTDETDETNTDA